MARVQRQETNGLGEEVKLIESVTEDERVFLITRDEKPVARCYDWWAACNTFTNVRDHEKGY